jgi:hypothetical protein
MVSSVILGARTVEQLRENLCAADLLLTGEEAGGVRPPCAGGIRTEAPAPYEIRPPRERSGAQRGDLGLPQATPGDERASLTRAPPRFPNRGSRRRYPRRSSRLALTAPHATYWRSCKRTSP